MGTNTSSRNRVAFLDGPSISRRHIQTPGECRWSNVDEEKQYASLLWPSIGAELKALTCTYSFGLGVYLEGEPHRNELGG